jgi:hypothetical protein
VRPCFLKPTNVDSSHRSYLQVDDGSLQLSPQIVRQLVIAGLLQVLCHEVQVPATQKLVNLERILSKYGGNSAMSRQPLSW